MWRNFPTIRAAISSSFGKSSTRHQPFLRSKSHADWNEVHNRYAPRHPSAMPQEESVGRRVLRRDARRTSRTATTCRRLPPPPITKSGGKRLSAEFPAAHNPGELFQLQLSQHLRHRLRHSGAEYRIHVLCQDLHSYGVGDVQISTISRRYPSTGRRAESSTCATTAAAAWTM